MLARFTDRAQRVMALAQENAKTLNHDYLGTEHLLLGLIGEGGGVAARALASFGISVQAARQQVEAISGQGQHASAGPFRMTRQASEVLKLSSRQALELGHNYVGPEHILLGLIDGGDDVAAQVLNGLGAAPETIRREVLEVLLSDLLDRINTNSLEWRFSAVALVQRAATGPDMPDLDREIAQVRHDLESAIEAQNFDNAVELRARYMQLLDDKASRLHESARPTDLPSLSAQVELLRNLLRQQSPHWQDDMP